MSEKRRKLIFFWTYLEWGGAQIYFIAIMKLAKEAWDVVVVLPRTSSAELIGFLERIDVKYEFIDAVIDLSPASSIGAKVRRQFRRLRAELASFRYLLRFDLAESVLHIETPPWQSWLFLTALLLRRANIFVTFHNALPKSAAWRETIWKARMQLTSRFERFHIFTSNKDTKERFHGWVTDECWQKIRVTYTCVDPPEIQKVLSDVPERSVLRRGFGIEADRFVVLCVGRFIDRKGRWVFLDAAKSLIDANPDILFVWLTPQLPEGDELERVNQYGLGDNFRLVLSETVGSKREDILRFYCMADIFALPSYVEGLPIALLEAMALGLAVISTNINAIPEAVLPDETGLLIEAGDAAALARAILSLKNDEPLRRRLAASGKSFVLENFDERAASRIAIDAYEECFKDGR